MFFDILNLALVDWLNNNYWWPVILFFGALIVIVRIMLIQPQKKKLDNGMDNFDQVVEKLGSIDNIVSCSIEGSRVKFQLKEIELADLQAFKEMGATGVFISGRNVKMVLPFSANSLIDEINKRISGGGL